MDIIILCNHQTFLVSHRLSLVRKLVAEKHVVSVYTGTHTDVKREALAAVALKELGINVYKSKDLYKKIIRRNIQKKSTICAIGLFASLKLMILRLFCRKHAVTYLLTGLGSGYHTRRSYRIVIVSVLWIYFRVIGYGLDDKVIVQNNHDYTLFRSIMSFDRVVKISGSGITISEASMLEKNEKENMILFASRLVTDKGVLEYIEAGRSLKKAYPSWRVILAGDYYPNNPNSIDESTLRDLLDQTGIEFIGYRSDILEWMKAAKIFVLPSHHEGLPRAVMEACDAGCAIVTTNAPGCDDVIEDGVHGFKVAVGDVIQLKGAIAELIEKPELLSEFSINCRKHAKRNFDVDDITQQYFDVLMMSAAKSGKEII